MTVSLKLQGARQETRIDWINLTSHDSIPTGRTNSRQVWVVNHYASAPHKAGGGGRHYYLGQWLETLGWSTTLIGSTTMHPAGAQAFEDFKLVRRRMDAGVECLWVWSNSYRSGGFARAVGMGIFTLGVLIPQNTRLATHPDIIIGSTVHLLAAWAGQHLAKRHKVPFVYEVRDLWPETLVDLGALKPDSILTRAIKRLSLSLAKNASLVISPLPGVGNYLHEENIDTPFLWLANGTDETLVSPELSDTSTTPSSFTFMYLGSHGRANALNALLKAFSLACEEDPSADLNFRLVGSGPEKSSLISLAKTLAHGDRIRFEDHIPRVEVNARAREADCLVVNLLDRPIYRYGISLNKIFDYLLSSRPIIIGSNALNDPVSEAGAGLSVPADDIEALAQAMLEAYRMEPKERTEMGRRGKEHVLENYSYKAIAERLATKLDSLA